MKRTGLNIISLNSLIEAVRKILIILVPLLVIVSHCQAQKHTYKIEWKGDSIGYLIAEKTKQGTLTTIELTSVSEFSIIISFQMETEYLSVFRNDQMLSALSRSILNNKERSNTKTKYVNDFYEITQDGEIERIEKAISESIATLYFTPPTGQEVYSERHGIFCKIKKISENHYRLIKPDDRVNDYKYSTRGCDEVQVELAMANILLKRIL